METQETENKHYERVRALLAKAESTTFSEEAQALIAKAQELMTLYALDDAMVSSATSSGAEPELVVVTIPNPYAARKFSLLSVIAQSNRCRAVWNSHTKEASVIGYLTDQAAVDALFTSLLLQGTAAVEECGSHVEYGVNRTKSFRNAFWAGFAQTIGQRLREANQAATETATRTYGSSLVPVMAEREEAVEMAVHQHFPLLGRMRSSVSNGLGYAAGGKAGAAANLNPTPQVGN